MGARIDAPNLGILAERTPQAGCMSAATLLAGKFTELDHRQTFEALLPEWVGTLRELIEATAGL